MKRFGRVIGAVALTVLLAVGLTGCDGDNETGGGGNNTGGNNTGGNNTTDSKSDTLSYGGQKYKTVKIGKQTWMAENLNYSTSSGSSCYSGLQENCTKYGKLYTWETAKTVCPAGWHLPSRREWGDLAIAVDGTGEYGVGGEAGYNLKSNDGWYQSGDGADGFGFSALPGGYYYSYPDSYTTFDGRNYITTYYTSWAYGSIGYNGYWWMATEFSSSDAYLRRMDYNGGFVIEDHLGKDHSCSVRCIKNN
jgi:uncharacterized protein (TIGR02145 family)